jgi:hypothetical protein
MVIAPRRHPKALLDVFARFSAEEGLVRIVPFFAFTPKFPTLLLAVPLLKKYLNFKSYDVLRPGRCLSAVPFPSVRRRVPPLN